VGGRVCWWARRMGQGVLRGRGIALRIACRGWRGSGGWLLVMHVRLLLRRGLGCVALSIAYGRWCGTRRRSVLLWLMMMGRGVDVLRRLQRRRSLAACVRTGKCSISGLISSRSHSHNAFGGNLLMGRRSTIARLLVHDVCPTLWGGC